MKKRKEFNKKKFIRICMFLLIILWAYMVFCLSNQNGPESSGLSRKIVEIFTKEEEVIEKVEPYVRKLAHFSEYGLGGILFISLFSTYDYSDRRKIATSVLLGIWYAITDEVHQLLVSERNGSLFDVYIDSLGFATGVCSMLILIKLVEILKKRKKEEKK